MVPLVLLCTDGSDLAFDALARGLEVVARGGRVVVATVVEFIHPIEVVGTGVAGGVLSAQDAVRLDEDSRRAGQEMLDETCTRLALTGAETTVLDGSPGPALCELAATLDAGVMVIGTRGRGGLRRAVLGSVSDHVVRNAPCPVVVVSAG